jgi:molybdopterin synthase sulfur carrier subunit
LQVNFYATLRDVVGRKSVEIELDEGASVRDLLDALVRSFPALGELLLDEHGALSRHVHVFIDGRGAPYLHHGLDTRLEGGPRIDVFPAVAGG